MRKIIIKLILLCLTISLFSMISSNNYSRVLISNSKAIYKVNLFGTFYEYFKSLDSSKDYFNIPKSSFYNEETKETFKFMDDYISVTTLTIPKSTEAEITLKDDCSVNHKSTAKIIFEYNSKDAVYIKDAETEKDVSISIKFELSNFTLSRSPLTTSPIFEYKFVSYDSELTLRFAGDASTESEALFKIQTIKDKLISQLKKFIDANLRHQVTVLNTQNTRQLDLQATNLPDNKPAFVSIQLAELPSCKDDFILEKYSASITESYTATKDLEYTFDNTLSDSQIIYDYSLLLDELVQSRINHERFSFTVSKTNASDLNIIGFKIDDLAGVFNDIKIKYYGGDEYIADCLVENASSKVTPPANDSSIPAITIAKIRFDLKDLSAESKDQTIESVYADYTLKFEYKVSEGKFVVSCTSIDLFDFAIKSQKLFNIDLLSKILVKDMELYLKKSPIDLFKLNNNPDNTGKFEVKKEGILYYISKPVEKHELTFLSN